MSVTMQFTPIPEKKKLKADINGDVMVELELFLEAAREDYDWLTIDEVVEQLLGDALKKDRAFRSWLKKRRQTEQTKQQPELNLASQSSQDPEVVEQENPQHASTTSFLQQANG